MRIAHALKTLGCCLLLPALFASGAKAGLIPAATLCEAIGEFRGCAPDSAEPFPSENFVVTDLEDQLFLIDGEETAIILVMNQGATADRLDGTGFRLVGLQSTPRIIEPIESGDIDYLGDWTSFPASLPVVTNFDINSATIEWTDLADAGPALGGGSSIRINLSFVPEPGTALLLGAGLVGLAARRRSRLH